MTPTQRADSSGSGPAGLGDDTGSVRSAMWRLMGLTSRGRLATDIRTVVDQFHYTDGDVVLLASLVADVIGDAITDEILPLIDGELFHDQELRRRAIAAAAENVLCDYLSWVLHPADTDVPHRQEPTRPTG